MAGCGAYSTMGVAEKVTNGKYPNLKTGPWGACIHLITHMAVGTVIFVVIALFAFGLGQFVKLLEAWGASKPLIYILVTVEYILVVVDVALFLYLLVKSVVKVGKETEL